LPKDYDATVKALLETSPGDWPRLVGLPDRGAVVIDADVSTVSGGADKVIRFGDPPEGLVHLEFQSSPDRSVPGRAFMYNAILGFRHHLPVQTVVVVLRPEADLRNLTGVYERRFPGRPPYQRSEYQVIRVWQLPPETFLTGGPGLLPLAPISAVTKSELPTVIERMKGRLSPRTGLAGDLWTATEVLMGLRYPESLVERLLQGVRGMEESVTYQAIVRKGLEKGRAEGKVEGLAEGRAEEARQMVLLLGEQRYGPPDARSRRALDAITDRERLRQLALRLQTAGSWAELLELPPPRKSRKS
jgi:predicted transposase YdaD